MNVPEWTKDEQSIEAAKSYLRQGGAVDFFEMVARSIIHNHPTNKVEFSLQIVNDILGGKEISADADFQPKRQEDNQYMRENEVSDFLDEWVLALLRERPGTDLERMQFHKRYLEGLRDGTTVTV
ncbi:hypothetical protein ABB37_02788 [Leptomonas pyrrhocoris]|uniref:Uncharacterized protein n=1 Tax=Leptomonas pyrrhocoris TaxID=157538 RepID=A0A0N0DXK9_LEPPY|nr:hypothetical protein ABB37_02788 [Leptomonas pyrrhocoris]XP_015661512.1 hypothetical protein ABB37_02788 [Leptomonas pyrrhocoris]KPA83072.1 hypothetical protein ABB37_02788 [Leptomonas pyrrhocoris]KPA83073.1 hypothetical protein ABB37_02788 [Leptomonas pyrrhocoris]|eukprot:XP_015661511.1 hypothetical protein ABB37_02788 [Leptomonas pyrrhocoris]